MDFKAVKRSISSISLATTKPKRIKLDNLTNLEEIIPLVNQLVSKKDKISGPLNVSQERDVSITVKRKPPPIPKKLKVKSLTQLLLTLDLNEQWEKSIKHVKVKTDSLQKNKKLRKFYNKFKSQKSVNIIVVNPVDTTHHNPQSSSITLFDQGQFPRDHFLSFNDNETLTGALLYIINSNDDIESLVSNTANTIY